MEDVLQLMRAQHQENRDMIRDELEKVRNNAGPQEAVVPAVHRVCRCFRAMN